MIACTARSFAQGRAGDDGDARSFAKGRSGTIEIGRAYAKQRSMTRRIARPYAKERALLDGTSRPFAKERSPLDDTARPFAKERTTPKDIGRLIEERARPFAKERTLPEDTGSLLEKHGRPFAEGRTPSIHGGRVIQYRLVGRAIRSTKIVRSSTPPFARMVRFDAMLPGAQVRLRRLWTRGRGENIAGQPAGAGNLTSGTPNDGGLSGASLSGPVGVWSDGTRLYVVDSGNNRVLVWNAIPSSPVPADFALGQPAGASNLTTNKPNGGGVTGARPGPRRRRQRTPRSRCASPRLTYGGDATGVTCCLLAAAALAVRSTRRWAAWPQAVVAGSARPRRTAAARTGPGSRIAYRLDTDNGRVGRIHPRRTP